MPETLLEYLRRPNPKIKHMVQRDDKGKKSKSSTRNLAYFFPFYIRRWNEIKMSVLRDHFNGILENTKARPYIDNSPRAIQNELGFGDIVLEWNRKITSAALLESQEYLGFSETIEMVRGCNAQKFPGSSRLGPDWATVVNAGTPTGSNPIYPEPSIMPGDSKYSKHWSSADIKEGVNKYRDPNEVKIPPWMWPIAQIYTYCRMLQTRYGYLITDKELVLVRIRPFEDSPSSVAATQGPDPNNVGEDDMLDFAIDERGMLEYASIPWCNGKTAEGNEVEEGNGMSVNTALWWVHVLAARDNSIKWTYPLLEDDPFLKDPRGSVRDDTHVSLTSRSPSIFEENNDPLYSSFQSSQGQRYDYSVAGLESPKRVTRHPKRRGQPAQSTVSDTKREGLRHKPDISLSQTSMVSEDADVTEKASRKRKLRSDALPRGPNDGKRKGKRGQLN